MSKQMKILIENLIPGLPKTLETKASHEALLTNNNDLDLALKDPDILSGFVGLA